MSKEHGLVPDAAATTARGALAPLVRALAALGVTPNAVTVVGFLLTAVGAALAASLRPVDALAVLLVGTAADALDGQLARLTARVTRFGSFLDSTLDRLGDAFIYGGVAVIGFRSGDTVAFGVGLWALVAAFLVSYVRAKAESLSLDATVGVAPREARTVLVLVGLFLWIVLGDATAYVRVVALIALLATITVAHRVVHVARHRAQA